MFCRASGAGMGEIGGGWNWLHLKLLERANSPLPLTWKAIHFFMPLPK